MNRLESVSFRPLGQTSPTNRLQPAQWNVNAIITTPEVTTPSKDRFTPSTRFSASSTGSEIFLNPQPQSGFFQALMNRITHNIKPSH